MGTGTEGIGRNDRGRALKRLNMLEHAPDIGPKRAEHGDIAGYQEETELDSPNRVRI